MTLGAAGRALLVVFTAVIIQLTIGTDLRIGTAHPEILWLLPITAAWSAGPSAVRSWDSSGDRRDLFVPAPFGYRPWWVHPRLCGRAPGGGAASAR